MIISFIGCPRSGKTTTASRVFSNLKDAGFNAEFIPEQARLFIAQKRVEQNLTPEQNVSLSDEDQVKIMYKQYDLEELMNKACGEQTLIVSDSSPLNSILYMSENKLQTTYVQNSINSFLSRKTIYFYAQPVKWIGGSDPNRVHSQEQSLQIDQKIRSMVLTLPELKEKYIELFGSAEERARIATSYILDKIMYS